MQSIDPTVQNNVYAPVEVPNDVNVVEPIAETVSDIILQNINWPIREVVVGNTYSNPTQVIPTDATDEKQLVAYFNACQADYKEFLKKCKEDKVDKNSEEFKKQNDSYQEVFSAIRQLAGNILNESKLNDFFKRNVAFQQVVEGKEGKQIKNAYPRLDTSRISGELQGDLASVFCRKSSGGGKEVNSTQWHSGMIFKLSPMSKVELITLNTAIVKARWEVGRDTRLSVFSGDDVTIQTLIIDSILPHIVNSNLKTGIKVNYKSILKVTDISNIQSSILASLYPLGYPVRRVCVHVDDKNQPCKHIHTSPLKENGDWQPDGLMDFNNVLWVDPTNISLDMRLHLSSGFNVHTLEDVLEYQKTLETKTLGLNPPVYITEDEETITTITFKVPTIEEYENAGNMYKSLLINLFDKNTVDDGTMSEQQKELEKVTLLKAYSSSLALCKHLAWIKSINFSNKQNPEITATIKDVKDIFKNLESLSDIDGCKEIIEKEVESFKEKSLITFQGINNYVCPSCNRGQLDKPTRNTSLIPLHMVGYFFSTIQLYLSKVTN